MLTELHLRNYILIQELKLSFNKGMTVLTGETGAGKSILVGALNLIFGKSGTQQIAFDPQKDVYLEICFTIPADYIEVHNFLNETGFPAEDNQIIVTREFSVTGKNTSYLNGRKTSTSVLKELHDLLIDFHHQRDQQNLLNPVFQLDLLDQFGGLMPLRNKFRNNLQNLKNSIQALKIIQEAEENNKQLIELYRFQLNELDSANLTNGEDTELEQEFELLSHSEEIVSIATQAYGIFYEQEDSIYDSMSQVLSQLQKYNEISTNINGISSELENCINAVQEVSTQFRTLKEKVEADPERLNLIRLRLDTINNLKTKYKQNTIEELLEYRNKIEQAILSQDSRSDEIKALTDEIDKLFDALIAKANELTKSRTKTAASLAKNVTDNVKQLSIPNARFEIKIDKKAEDKILLAEIGKVYSDSGQDNIEFRFSANPDSPVLPLKSIVSGGELSRILLATKKSLAQVMPPRTVILDEIDIGIGGKTAGALADFIHGLAKDYQVICITHLAKIAAQADNHIFIDKKTLKDKTRIEVETLDSQKRITEIARMLSGQITDLSVRHAKELLNIK